MGYDELQEKYGLPSFSELDNEYELDEPKKFILREIRRKINGKLDMYLDVLESVLNPESTTSGMHEGNHLSDIERRNILSLFKRLMKIRRTSTELGLLLDEEKDAAFIKDVYNQWKSIKEEVLKVVRRMKDSWDKESLSHDVGYLG